MVFLGLLGVNLHRSWGGFFFRRGSAGGKGRGVLSEILFLLTSILNAILLGMTNT